MKIKNVLISQPQPENEKSPYTDLAKQFNLNITFRKLIKIESVDNKEFRKLRINILDYTAIIFTSRHSVDHFFSLCEELRVTIPESMKYFCVSEAIALYLQKYVQYRKRKIFFGKSKFPELLELIKKQKNEKFFFPCAVNHTKEIPDLLQAHKINHVIVPIYNTAPDTVDDIEIDSYHMIVFFSPFGIESLQKNFPDYKQDETIFAAFGQATVSAIESAGFEVQIKAPSPEAPSMTMAIEQYLQNHKAKK
ncbi:MAG: uroporphyrinogen-III synthase [Bacteroidales bacterium]|nr:uroporphyrinogen-III synthase [Bacteroidales bacterium]